MGSHATRDTTKNIQRPFLKLESPKARHVKFSATSRTIRGTARRYGILRNPPEHRGPGNSPFHGRLATTHLILFVRSSPTRSNRIPYNNTTINRGYCTRNDSSHRRLRITAVFSKSQRMQHLQRVSQRSRSTSECITYRSPIGFHPLTMGGTATMRRVNFCILPSEGRSKLELGPFHATQAQAQPTRFAWFTTYASQRDFYANSARFTPNPTVY